MSSFTTSFDEAERADMALSYVFEEQLHGGTLTLNRALSDGLTTAQHAARLTDWLAASEDWPGPWLFNRDPFTDAEKTAYELKVLTARRKLGHKGHTEAVRRIAVALGIDLDQAASVLGLRGHTEAVRRIAAALDIDLDQARSELSRRGGNGSTATLEGYDTGTHISKGKGKTPKGELTTACKDRPGELGRLKSSYLRIETKESFDAKLQDTSIMARSQEMIYIVTANRKSSLARQKRKSLNYQLDKEPKEIIEITEKSIRGL